MMIDLASLDYSAKIKALEAIAQQVYEKGERFAKVAGEYTQLRAELSVLRQVSSALQSALRAERES